MHAQPRRRAKLSYANGDAARLYELAIDAARAYGTHASQKRCGTMGCAGRGALACRIYGRVDFRISAVRCGWLAGNPMRALVCCCSARWRVNAQGAFAHALRDIAEALRLLKSSRSAAGRRLQARLRALRAMIFFAQNKPARALAAAREADVAARKAHEIEALARALLVQEAATQELEGPGDGHFSERSIAVW